MNDTTKEARYELCKTDIPSKSGNYVFTVGNVSSGKSTLQNILIYRLWTYEKLKFHYANKSGDHRHDALLNAWVKDFAAGKFPGRSKKGLLQEFTITFGQKRRRDLTINFVEMSGEDVRSIVPSLSINKKPALNSDFTELLKLKKINKRFIFVSDSESNSNSLSVTDAFYEDIMFVELIRHLTSSKGIGLKKLNVLFIAAKWDSVSSEYDSVEEYFRDNFPNSRSYLDQGSVEITFIPFSIGSVEMFENPSDEGASFQRIATLECRYVDILIQWIYESFMNRTLEHMPKVSYTRLEKLNNKFLKR